MKILLTLLLLVTGFELYGANDMEIVKQRIRDNRTVDEAKVKYVRERMQLLTPDGYWKDINYNSRQRGSWPVKKHYDNIVDFADCYIVEGSPLKGNKELKDAVERSVNWFLDENEKRGNWCPNWWYNQLNIPNQFGLIGIIMEGNLSKEVEQKLLARTASTKIAMTGQNRVWHSVGVLQHGLLTGNESNVLQASKEIFNQVKINVKGEGIKQDFSFHQHGAQLQLGNYGLAFIKDIAKWSQILGGTKFDMTPEQHAVYTQYFLEGQNWIPFRGFYDINSCGRQLMAPSKKYLALVGAAEIMKQTDKKNYGKYQNIINRNNKENYNIEKEFVGNKMFYTSDFMVHRQKDYMVSVKMCSNRIKPHEEVNSENKTGFFMGMGSTFLYKNFYSKGDYEDSLAVYDWHLVPGTISSPAARTKPRGLVNVSSFAGGVSDGMYGACAFEFKPAKISTWQLSSRQSWFFFDNLYVMLGTVTDFADVKDKVTISFAQRIAGTPTVDGKKITEGINKYDFITAENSDTFYTPGNDQRTIAKVETITDSWYDSFRKSIYRNQKLTYKMFKLYSELTPENPQYSCIVSPNMGNLNIEIVNNTKEIQAVYDIKQETLQAVFFESGELKLSNSKLKVEAPCILMLDNKKNILYLTDPTQKLKSLKVTLNSTAKTVKLPSDKSQMGKTVSISLK